MLLGKQRHWLQLVLLVACSFFTRSCDQHLDGYAELTGNTMGTYYRIVGKCPVSIDQTKVEARLEALNALYSTYVPSSTISKFNQTAVDRWFDAPAEFVELVVLATHIGELTSGAFDITVYPLVDAWGFGTQEVNQPPSAEEIVALRERIGDHNIEIRLNPPGLRKRTGLEIDLAGIAKGHAVDTLAQLLDDASCQAYLVDIGGEIRVHGTNPVNQPWLVGIEHPAGSDALSDSIALQSGSLATSGTYRNFYELEGTRMSHVIDPRTGYPVLHRVVGVSVIAASTAVADGFATGMLVLGEDALALADELNLAVLIYVQRPGRAGFETRYSRAFVALRNGTDSNAILNSIKFKDYQSTVPTTAAPSHGYETL